MRSDWQVDRIENAYSCARHIGLTDGVEDYWLFPNPHLQLYLIDFYHVVAIFKRLPWPHLYTSDDMVAHQVWSI
jgi:hypothetical protein